MNLSDMKDNKTFKLLIAFAQGTKDQKSLGKLLIKYAITGEPLIPVIADGLRSLTIPMDDFNQFAEALNNDLNDDGFVMNLIWERLFIAAAESARKRVKG